VYDDTSFYQEVHTAAIKFLERPEPEDALLKAGWLLGMAAAQKIVQRENAHVVAALGRWREVQAARQSGAIDSNPEVLVRLMLVCHLFVRGVTSI
jgi:hypothetical protein